MLKTGTYILFADEGSSIWAEVDMEQTVIHDGDEEYPVPTYYLEMLMEELYG